MKIYNFLIVLIACLLFSCKKQKVVCTGNCYSLNLNGKVVNSLTNANAPNVPLIIYQWRYTVSRRDVQEFYTNASGIFNTTISIDSTMFQNGYYLSLSMKENNQYMTLRNYENIRINDLSTNPINNISIPVYPKVNLTIKLNRNQNDNFQFFQVSYYFITNDEFIPFSILTPQDINKTELIVPTTPDIYTKIKVIKTNSSGIATESLDSIKCIKNGENVFTVNF